MSKNRTQELQDRVRAALNNKTMLNIVGGNSKHFYGNSPVDTENNKTEIIETRIHQGIISYEPSELVITARAGTPLKEIEALLAEKNNKQKNDDDNDSALFAASPAGTQTADARPRPGSAESLHI